MSAMQILKSLDKKYKNSAPKVKAQLYLLPILIVALLFILLSGETKAKTTSKLIDYDSLKMKENMLDIVNNIEKFGKENKIRFIYIKSNNKTISIQANSSFSSMKKFISYIDGLNAFSNIEELNIQKKKSKYSYFLSIDFKRFYFKEKQVEIKASKIKSKNKFILKAIVSKNVLINNSWLKEGESIQKYEIKEVLLNEVILVKDDEKINLKVYKNDKYIE